MPLFVTARTDDEPLQMHELIKFKERLQISSGKGEHLLSNESKTFIIHWNQTVAYLRHSSSVPCNV